METVPLETPFTIPVADPTFAKTGFELIQNPPDVGLVSVTLLPTQAADGPEIGVSGFTVIVVVV
jgi:hypothetical protein